MEKTMSEKLMPRSQWEQAMAQLISKHVAELHELAFTGEISANDHDQVGFMVQHNIAYCVTLSEKAWETFVRIINESRALQKVPHGP